MKKILVTCGDPSGIGPDLCTHLAYMRFGAQITVIGSSKVISERAKILKTKISFDKKNSKHNGSGKINIIDFDYPSKVKPGIPNKNNSKKQLEILDYAINLIKEKKFNAIVTLPINKKILSTKKEKFIGHTEYIAKRCKIKMKL